MSESDGFMEKYQTNKNKYISPFDDALLSILEVAWVVSVLLLYLNPVTTVPAWVFTCATIVFWMGVGVVAFIIFPIIIGAIWVMAKEGSTIWTAVFTTVFVIYTAWILIEAWPFLSWLWHMI